MVSGKPEAASRSSWNTLTLFKNVNDDKEVDVIYLDYSKAFDKVDTKSCLLKLEDMVSQAKCTTGSRLF